MYGGEYLCEPVGTYHDRVDEFSRTLEPNGSVIEYLACCRCGIFQSQLQLVVDLGTEVFDYGRALVFHVDVGESGIRRIVVLLALCEGARQKAFVIAAENVLDQWQFRRVRLDDAFRRDALEGSDIRVYPFFDIEFGDVQLGLWQKRYRDADVADMVAQGIFRSQEYACRFGHVLLVPVESADFHVRIFPLEKGFHALYGDTDSGEIVPVTRGAGIGYRQGSMAVVAEQDLLRAHVEGHGNVAVRASPGMRTIPANVSLVSAAPVEVYQDVIGRFRECPRNLLQGCHGKDAPGQGNEIPVDDGDRVTQIRF